MFRTEQNRKVRYIMEFIYCNPKQVHLAEVIMIKLIFFLKIYIAIYFIFNIVSYYSM